MDAQPNVSSSAAAGALDPQVEEVDLAIAREDEARSASRSERLSAAARILSLPRLLRGIGSAVLVAAAFTFMLQGWEGGDDVARYLHFLGFTAALAGAGFVCGLRIRDEKGARTFLGLAAGMVPVHFTVLGALLYSQFPWLSGFADYPAYAHFSAPDRAAALLTTAFGVAALVPVCWTAFLTFARPEARRLTAVYLLTNAALLIPTRQPDVIGLLALALPCGLLAFDRHVLRPTRALRTPEGRFVRASLWAPLAILIGRTLNLYEPSALFCASVSAIASGALFVGVPAVVRSRRWARRSQHAGLIPAAAACVFAAHALASAVALDAAWWLPLVCLPTSFAIAGLSLRAVDGGAGMRRLAALVAAGGMLIQLVTFPAIGSSLACLATAIVAAAYGYASEQRGVFLTGLGALAFGLIYHVRYAVDLYALSPWGVLALLGIATVLVASLLERHHRVLAARVLEFKGRFDTWST